MVEKASESPHMNFSLRPIAYCYCLKHQAVESYDAPTSGCIRVGPTTRKDAKKWGKRFSKMSLDGLVSSLNKETEDG